MSHTIRSTKEKTIFLKDKDGEAFPIKLKAARRSAFVDKLITDLALDEEIGVVEIPLGNIESAELKKVIKFLEGHSEDISSLLEYSTSLKKKNLSYFDRTFIKMDQKLLIDVYKAADSLEIAMLRELMAFAISQSIKGKEAVEINKQFNVTNDLSDWELRKIKKERKGEHEKKE